MNSWKGSIIRVRCKVKNLNIIEPVQLIASLEISDTIRTFAISPVARNMIRDIIIKITLLMGAENNRYGKPSSFHKRNADEI